MKTCKSGSEGVSVKPDVEIHEGARLLPYKGTWSDQGFPSLSWRRYQDHRRTGETYVIHGYVCGTWKPRTPPNRVGAL